VIATLSALVRRLRAPNPSVMTGMGTNTYLVGTGDVTVIDPGPKIPRHIGDLVEAVRGERIVRILLTHAHADHAPGAALLAGQTRAPVLAFRQPLRDGDVLSGGGATIEVLHTPGHSTDHLCFRLDEERALFSGDLVMSGSTVVIVPPEGEMIAYLGSLRRLRQMDIRCIYPGHGDVIDAPRSLLDEYIAHRLMRERQIREALREGSLRIADLVRRIYAELPDTLHSWAAHSVHAHLIKLRAEGEVAGADLESEWRLT
jgi:glyoxylase-like metal-dependent hydrolase (beta-lactamase superfamily II)